MRTVLQVTFCILSVLSVVAAMVLGVWKGFLYALYGILAAALFGLFMLLAKYAGVDKKEVKTDFLNTPEENERILEQPQKQNEEEKEDSSPDEK